MQREGLRLTRDALAARLRENGHPVGNSRLALLLQVLRDETAATFLTGANVRGAGRWGLSCAVL